MKRPDPEKQTRFYLFFTAVSVMLSASLLLWSFSEVGQARKTQQTGEAKRQQIEQKLQQAVTERDEYHRLLPAYEKIIGKESSSPQSRAETLLNLHKELLLPALSYEFQPPHPLHVTEQGSPGLSSHPLKVHLDLLHEADLLRFLEKLPQRTHDLLLVRHCQLIRSSAALTADCEIDWISLVETAS